MRKFNIQDERKEIGDAGYCRNISEKVTLKSWSIQSGIKISRRRNKYIPICVFVFVFMCVYECVLHKFQDFKTYL